jgi:hypothetical protein
MLRVRNEMLYHDFQSSITVLLPVIAVDAVYVL